MSSDEPMRPAVPSALPEQTSEATANTIGTALRATAGYLLGRDSSIAREVRSEAPTDPVTSASQEVLPVAGRTYEELAREIIELEKQFALPEQDDIIADAKWFEKQWETLNFDPYRGTHIAILNGAIVGHGWNSLQLQLEVARKFHVHPQRFIVEYIPPRDF